MLHFVDYNIQRMGVLKKSKEAKRSNNHFPFETKKRVLTSPQTITKSALRSLIRAKLNPNLLLKNPTQNTSTSKLKNVKLQNLQALISESDCECPCCLELLMHPVVLGCRHTYCLKCFEQNSASTLRCPLCRQDINHEDITLAKTTQTIIEGLLLPKTTQFYNYWCRKGDFQEWENVRRVNMDNLRAIDRVDVRTQDGIWRSAVVLNYQLVLGEYQLCLRINDYGKSEVLKIQGSSRNLASFGFFTKRIYLKYRMVEKPLKFMENIDIPQIDAFPSHAPEQHILVSDPQNSQAGLYDYSQRQFALQLLQHHSDEWNQIDFL